MKRIKTTTKERMIKMKGKGKLFTILGSIIGAISAVIISLLKFRRRNKR